MKRYIFKIKKGEIEIELSSDDAKFVEEQMNLWRENILKNTAPATQETEQN